MNRFINSYKQTLCFFFLNFCVITSFSQNVKFKLEDLKGKTWSMLGLNDKTYDEEYENGKILLFLTDKYFGAQDYYLSDSIVSVFDSSKIGKVTEGKYIVRRFHRDKEHSNTPQPISVFEIREIGPTKLVIRYIKHQHLLEYRIKK